MDAHVRPASIELVGITKEYRLYHRSVDRLVELLAPNGRVRHDTIHALSDVTLSVGAGERVGILGANGSGKSTLLKVISQVLTPTAGEVRVTGRVSALLELGIGFAGELTGRENIIQYGILQGLTRNDIASRCEEIIGFSEIEEYIDQPIRTYSSGMVLRLAFACAVFTDPDVLIIDEALSVGDSYFQAKCLHKIRSMLDRGITFLYVSHSADSVRSLCTRGVLMEKGRVVLDGASIDVAREYERRAFIRASRYQGESALNGEALTAAKPEEADVHSVLNVVSDNATPSEREFARRVAAMRSGNGTVRITNVEVLNAEGSPTEVVAHGEPLNIRVSYRVTAVPGLHTSIGVGICDRLGNQLVHLNTLDKRIDLAGTTPGAHGSILFRLSNSFCPGDFGVIVGCSTMKRHPMTERIWLGDKVYDYCVGGANFTVPASSAKTSLWGAVALPYEAEARLDRARATISQPGLPAFKMEIHGRIDKYVSRQIASEQTWEPFETEVVREILRHVNFLVDVGANIGWYTLIGGLALQGRGQVISFEPDPENFAILARNVAQNELTNVKVFNAALADGAGTRELFRSTDNLGDHRLYAGSPDRRDAISVNVTTFDDTVAPLISGPCLVKLDTQGSEAMILKGMRRYLEGHASSVAFLIEYWPFGLDNAGSAASELISLLARLGLNAWIVDEAARVLVRTTYSELADRAHTDLRPETQGFANILLVPAGHPAEAARAEFSQARIEPAGVVP